MVATHTLRIATNAQTFIDRAAAHFPAPIEIITGTQEARYIYQGVSHISDIRQPLLVIDIGGGSTEFIVGKDFKEEVIRSRPLGCVNMTQKFFPDRRLTHLGFTRLMNHAAADFATFKDEFIKRGWTLCMGSSGSIKAIDYILKEDGYQKRSITLEHLLALRDRAFEFETIDEIDLPGLPDKRGPILPAAIAILLGAFKTLGIERMEYSRGALREGLLYSRRDYAGRWTLDAGRWTNCGKPYLSVKLFCGHPERGEGSFAWLKMIRRDFLIQRILYRGLLLGFASSVQLQTSSLPP